ncbi:MAG TPA: ABC transporter permease [Candidatus Ornithocaccomicrobium faecavium]|uniref:ABC transporter permease n=1 Tax=Candidatus Ornithocaccomicrobium faecavium TaxID=2840890 RepID=A0A9D1TC25_9FIRM|nr:ABC transporter permease [Candidatus Ornithocaccomicrobium faecavium]
MHSGLYRRLAASTLKKNARTYLPYLLSACGTVAVFYILAYLALDSGSGTTGLVMQLGAIVVGIFALIFLFYTNSFLIKRRKKELGLYGILGMEKRHIFRMMAYETLYCFLISVVSGLAVGLLFSKGVQLLFLHILQMPVQWGFAFSPSAALVTVLLFAGIFFLTLLSNLRQVHISQPIELLRGSQVGEREPRANWPLAILGVVLLAAGYALAQFVNNPLWAFILFFLAVILVILGTYALFTSTSIAALKLLRRNKAYYYQTKHFISVSGMIYRMKQNAAGLASICILSTMVLVMVSTTTSLYAGMNEMFSWYTRDFRVRAYTDSESGGYTPSAPSRLILSQQGYAPLDEQVYSSLSFATVRDGEGGFTFVPQDDANAMEASVDDVMQFTMLTLADYNLLVNNAYELAQGEVLLAAARGTDDFDQPELRVFGLEFDVAANVAAPDIYAADYMGTELYYLIVPDAHTFWQIANLEIQFYGNNATYVENIYAFNVDAGASVDEQAALRTDLLAQGSVSVTCTALVKQDAQEFYGSFFFLGIFLGLLFLMATAMIIYYKQISEGYDDRARFELMQKVGMTAEEIRSAVRSQVLTVFFFPLVMAGVHIVFAFKMIAMLMSLLQLTNTTLFALTTVVCFFAFAAVYALIYAITARSYYRIVS